MLEEKFQILDQKVTRLLEEIDRLREENRGLNAQVHALGDDSEKLKAVSAERDGLQEQLEQARGHSEEKNREAAEARAKVGAHQERVTELEQELEMASIASREVEELRKENEYLQEKIEEMAGEVEQTSTREQEVRERLKSIIDRIDALDLTSEG